MVNLHKVANSKDANNNLEPLLFRLNGEFRAFFLEPGSFLEYYPHGSDGARHQVFLGPLTKGEYFIVIDEFRCSPFGCITYRVRVDGTLHCLDQNL